MRIPLCEFADFLYRLGVNLALHLGDVDHRRVRLEMATDSSEPTIEIFAPPG